MNMKKILFIEFFKHAGAPAGLLTELEQLVLQQKYVPFVIHTKGSILDNFLDEHHINHLQISNSDSDFYKIIGFIKIFFASLFFSLKVKPNVIHVNHYEWTELGVALALFTRKKLIVHLKDVYPIASPLRRFVFAKIYPKTYIAVSKYVKKFFCEKYGLASKRVVVIYDGIADEFANIETNKSRKVKGFVVGTISRIAPDRGIKEFIETAKLICVKHPDVLFYHLGYIEKNNLELKKYKNLVKKLHLGKRVRFLPYTSSRKKLHQFLSSLDVFLITAPRFAFPNVAVEALFSQVPVVASKVGGIPEIVQDGKNGYFVEPISAAFFTAKIEVLLLNTKLLKQFKKNSLRSVEKFKASKILPQLEKVYEEKI